MKSITSCILFLALSMSLSAQQEKITGTVVDHQTGEPLAGVTVKHISSGLEVMTDFDGNFTFSAADPGINRFAVTFVSYQEVLLNRVNVQNVQEEQRTELMIKMRRVGVGDQSGGYFMAARPDNNPRS